MAAPAPPAPEAPAAAPGGGAVGGQSAQLVQQILMLLTQLGQEQSDPNVQRLVASMMGPAQELEKALGANDEEEMQSGLNNPGGGAPESAAEEEAEGPQPAGEEAGEMPHGKPAVTIAIHAGRPGGSDESKAFGKAKDAARAAMKAGKLPSETARTKNRRKG